MNSFSDAAEDLKWQEKTFQTMESLLLIHLKTSLNVGNLDHIILNCDIDFSKAHKGVYDLSFPLNCVILETACEKKSKNLSDLTPLM